MFCSFLALAISFSSFSNLFCNTSLGTPPALGSCKVYPFGTGLLDLLDGEEAGINLKRGLKDQLTAIKVHVFF
jgi:hypothetical protein